MFQSFEATTSPEQGPERLRALRRELAADGLDGFLVPRADAHQGEYVAPRDERLSWLTGFTGSAGFCAVLQEIAGVFVDGRYRVQVKAQVADDFTPVNWPETKLGPWLAEHLPHGGKVGFDPWLHTAGEIEGYEKALDGSGVHLAPVGNLVDRIWEDQPAPPSGKVSDQPVELAGESSRDKIARMAKGIHAAGQKAAVLTLPDSISWLLNIRGSDIPRNPVVHAFAILHDNGRVSLFLDPSKVADLGPDPLIDVAPPEAFEAALGGLHGPVRVDKTTAPLAVSRILAEAGIEVAWGDDPCILPKARKNEVELASTTEAHLRDGAAMVEFLAWLDQEAPKGRLTEIDVVTKLETVRRASNALHDISFETICGAGPNGAIVHYRVTEGTNRKVSPGELLLIDSGGQYVDGTTDITRTVAVGAATQEQRGCFTRVLQGMIAISRARWPRGLAGRDLDALARAPLWMAGMDYDHGTGHGVGVFLSVHEGPQRLSRISEVPLEPGMILSNEPGYYREGAFGIRIENLIVVREAEKIADDRDQLCFETLTWVPIDRRLIDTALLSPGERSWINRYHADVRSRIGPRVGPEARAWLETVTRPI
jgi:Xaa-Pro aminopeptidase